MPNIPYLINVPVSSVTRVITPDVDTLLAKGIDACAVIKYTPDRTGRESYQLPIGGELDGTVLKFARPFMPFMYEGGTRPCMISCACDDGRAVYISSMDLLELFRLISSRNSSYRHSLAELLLAIDSVLISNHGFAGSIISRSVGHMLALTDKYVGHEVLEGCYVKHTTEHAEAHLSAAFDFSLFDKLESSAKAFFVNMASMAALELGLIARRPGLATDLH